MTNKHKVKDKQYANLGIRKIPNGEFEYMDPSEKNKSKYQSVRKYTKS